MSRETTGITWICDLCYRRVDGAHDRPNTWNNKLYSDPLGYVEAASQADYCGECVDHVTAAIQERVSIRGTR